MKRTILVVDDQADERDATATLLHRHGYFVEAYCNGREALDRLRGGSLPALMVLDLNMPVMDGWELLAHVARDASLRHLPVVVVSGASTVPDAIVAPRNVTFVAKPIRPHELVSIIAETLRHAHPATLTSPASWTGADDHGST